MTSALGIALVSGTAGYFLGQSRLAPAGENGAAEGGRVSLARRPAAVEDFGRLRAGLDREQDPLKRFRMGMEHLEEWVDGEPLAALEWLSGQQASARRDEVIRMALEQFAGNDPAGAARWAMENLGGVDLNNAMILISESWAERDGAGAVAWLAGLGDSPERDAALEGACFVWAADEPGAALDFAEKSGVEDALAATLRRAVFAGWAKSDPQGAAAASLESGRKHGTPDQFANTLANWAVHDLAAAADWLEGQGLEGGERALAVDELAVIHAHQSPEAGVAWLAGLDSGGERERAGSRFVSSWARTDPAEASEWLAESSVLAVDENAARGVLHLFFAEDSGRFDAWREGLPAGRLRDLAGETAAEP